MLLNRNAEDIGANGYGKKQLEEYSLFWHSKCLLPLKRQDLPHELGLVETLQWHF